MNNIAVAYATEEDYLGCTIISMLSILETADIDTFYKFYILIDGNFIEKNRQFIESYFEQYKRQCDVEFKKVNNVFDTVDLHIDSIKKPTYFRLLLPELLEEDKCIYLDSDTIVCTDLQVLFNIEMKDSYIAGVKAPGYVLLEDEKYCHNALLPDMQQYVNAGVLMMNLYQMRKDNLVKKFLTLLSLKMPSQDQDIINSVCYSKIVFLPFYFNVMTKYATWEIQNYKNIFSEKELKQAWNNPGIIHYADKEKPWKNLNCVMGEYWWNVCKRSYMWDCFYKKISDELFFKTLYSVNFNMSFNINHMIVKKTVTLFDLSYKTKIVIFGAGNRAIELIKYLKYQGIIPEFILVSKSINNPKILAGIKVKEVTDMVDEIVDCTIIIATLEKYHVEILQLLQKYRFKEILPLSNSWNFWL